MFKSNSGRVGDAQVVARLSISSPSKPKSTSPSKPRVSFEDPKSTYFLKNAKKFFKEKCITSDGDRILKSDRSLYDPKIGSGLVITPSSMLL